MYPIKLLRRNILLFIKFLEYQRVEICRVFNSGQDNNEIKGVVIFGGTESWEERSLVLNKYKKEDCFHCFLGIENFFQFLDEIDGDFEFI